MDIDLTPKMMKAAANCAPAEAMIIALAAFQEKHRAEYERLMFAPFCRALPKMIKCLSAGSI